MNELKFRNTLYRTAIVAIALLMTVSAVAQDVKLTGTVTSETGTPLIGASIAVKGTTVGTNTDSNGNFSLAVAADKNTLEVSFLGYVTEEVTIGARTYLSIVLKDDPTSLNEVVVVGYGTQKKVNLTGAVSTIDKTQLENRSVPSLTQALQGKVANLNVSTSNGAPGSRQSINIRGYSGIRINDNGSKSNVSASPLIVIDGVQGGDLSSINMNDVENISVLKDAASAAVYGSSAPYGVILITTKRGSAGKPRITYNNNFGFSQPVNLPHYVNSLDFALAFNEVAANSKVGAMFKQETIEKIRDYQAGKIKDETMKDPTKDNWLSWSSSWANNDWFKIYFKDNSFSHQHNLGVSGSTESSSYYVGLGYNNQEGLYRFANDNYKRYNVRANLSSTLTKYLTFNFRSAFSRAATDVPYSYSGITGTSDYSYGYFHQLGRTYPTVPVKNPDGNYSEASGIQVFVDGGRSKSLVDNVILTGEAVLHILPGWNATMNYTYDGTYSAGEYHKKTFYSTRPSGEKVARGGTLPNALERSMLRNQHHIVNAFTSYEIAAAGHSFKILGGFTQELYNNLWLSGSNDNLYTDEVLSLTATSGSNRKASDALSQLAIRGAFGRINYNYRDRYLLEINGRYDGSSRFLKNVRYKFYPGISAGWVVSNEPFWATIGKYVNLLKFRGSYASVGDHSFTGSYYPFYPELGSSSPTSTNWIFANGRESAIWQPGLVNYNLTWITTNTTGVGVDMAFLRNRLNVSFDLYRRHAKDFAGPGEELPALLGTSAPLKNNAETETRGFELTLSWKDRVGELDYGVTAVLGDYRGRVIKFNNPAKLISNTWYDGMTMGEIWGYETVGLFKNQAEIDGTNQRYINANWYPGDVHYKDLNNDGKIDIGKNTVADPGDRRIIGNSTPRYSFGVTLNAEWRGFDASVFLQGVGKRDIMFSSNANYFWGFAGSEWQSSYFTAHTDRWTEKNPNGYYPRAYFNTSKNLQSQTRYLQNAAYLRIKNVQLGYSVPKAIIEKIRFQKVRLFVNIENLATFTKLIKVIDPEIVSSEAKTYPLRRTFAFGINVTF